MPETDFAVRAFAATSSTQTYDRVALIADCDLCREMVEILEGEATNLDVFSHLNELLEQPPIPSPNVVVLWLEDSSLDWVEPLTHTLTRAQVVIVCTQLERWGVRAALAAGVAGVVLADRLDATLGPCLRAVLAGQTCVPREHWRQIEPPALSTREKQVLGLVVMGYMNSEIAQQLFLAESTVKSHLSSAFSKLGVRSRNEAVNLILDPERGYGMGILALGGEPLEPRTAVAQ